MITTKASIDMWISLHFAMSYYPKNRKMSIKSRMQHTFMYIVNGEYRYLFDKDGFTAKSGDLVYIPKGADYSYEIISGTAYMRQVEFNINNPSFLFTDKPEIIENVPNAESLLKESIENFGINSPKNYFKALCGLYELCRFIPFRQPQLSDIGGKIRPAIEYIEAHCTEKFGIQTLADLCFMSQAQLRRYFKARYKMSPVTYKNRFRIEKAKQMLLYDVADIGEIAEKMGFDSVYSFSKVFKTYAGITPSAFSKKKNS